MLDESLEPGEEFERKPINGIKGDIVREAYRNGKLQWSEKLMKIITGCSGHYKS